MPDELAKTMTADILPSSEGPALSATSDMPEVKADPPPPSEEVEPVAKSEETPEAEVGAAKTPEAVSEAAEEPAVAAAPEPKGVGKKLAALEREKAEAIRRAEIAEAQRATALQAIEQLGAKPETKADIPLVDTTPKPKRESFDTPDAYDEALIGWAADNAAKAATAKVERQAAEKAVADKKAADDAALKAQHDKIAADWNAKRESALEKYPDFADVAESDAVQITLAMRDAIFQAENGTDIAYHLGSKPELAQKISQLPVLQQIFEIGKLSDKLAAPAPVKTTKAPPPIKPLGARANAVAKTLYDADSMEEYAAMRQPQINAERRPAGMAVKPN